MQRFYWNWKELSAVVREKMKMSLSIRIWMMVFLLMVTVAPAHAVIIGVDGLLTKVLENNQNIRSFYLEMEARVYDPEAFSPIEEELDENLVPFEIKENAFFQKIVWVRDEYYLVETLDLQETPLNMYIFEPLNREYSQNLQENSQFTNEDVVYPYLKFFTKHISYLKTSLDEMGIATNRVVVKQKAASIVYQLGDETDNILVDPGNFRILEINRSIQIGGRYFPLRVVFSEWDKQKQYSALPNQTRFYVNSRLFKEMRIISKQRSVYRPRRNFFTKYLKKLPRLFPFSLTIQYSH